MNILFVTSSPRGGVSYSYRVARRIVDDVMARDPGTRLVVRDVAKQPLPHVAATFSTARAVPAEKQTDAERQALVLSDALVTSSSPAT